MRVYELAKKLGMENRMLIPELARIGITVASHSSTLDDDAVRKALEKFMPGAKPAGDAPKPAAKDAGAKIVVRKAAAAPPPSVEEPKADKKRILIKRKKSDEDIVAEPPPPPPAEPTLASV